MADSNDATDQTRIGLQPIASRTERLRMPVDIPLVVVSGILGSGKTTLLDDWFSASKLGGARRPVWLAIEGGQSETDQLVDMLRTEFQNVDGPTTVFIDDFDRVLSEESQRVALDSVLVHQPSTGDLGAQLVVSTSGRPSFPVGPLRAANVVAEIGDEQLAWTTSELDELAERWADASWPGLGEGLARLTNGWITGALAILDRLAIEDRQETASTIAPPLDALAEDASPSLVGAVESRLSAEDLRLLTQTSILETLTPSAVETVADTDADADLDRLERTGAPIARLDRHGVEFRLQPLVRRGLQRQLTELEDWTSRADRHVRAADYFHRSGLHRSAMQHYAAAGRHRLAADVLAELWSLDRLKVTETDIAEVEGTGTARYVPQLVTIGLVRGDRGRLDEVERVLEILATEEWDGRLPHGFSNLDAAVVELELLLPDLGVAKSERVVTVLTSEQHHNSDQPLTATYTAAHHSYYLGRFDEASRLAGSILVGHRSIGRRTQQDKAVTILAAGLEALIAHDHGDVAEATRRYEHSLELAKTYDLREHFPSAKHVRDLTHAVVGQPTSEIAEQLLSRVFEHSSYLSQRTHAGTELVRLIDRERRYDEAIELFGEIDKMVGDVPLPHLLARRLDALGHSFPGDPTSPGPSLAITPGERFVLHLLARQDLSQAEIGRILGLSINTVKSHLRSIYQKLGSTTREEALENAEAQGLLTSVLPWESQPRIR
ncbi:MAG: LuxR C-terminal-related transcriptional regulator [Acidimicrobiales bacterium]